MMPVGPHRGGHPAKGAAAARHWPRSRGACPPPAAAEATDRPSRTRGRCRSPRCPCRSQWQPVHCRDCPPVTAIRLCTPWPVHRKEYWPGVRTPTLYGSTTASRARTRPIVLDAPTCPGRPSTASSVSWRRTCPHQATLDCPRREGPAPDPFSSLRAATCR